jgi:hypothetical protein
VKNSLGLEELWFWVWKRLKGRYESAVVRRTAVRRRGGDEDGVAAEGKKKMVRES